MNTRKGRDGPNKEEGGQAQPSQARSTPKALPTESVSAFSYANAKSKTGQEAVDAEGAKDGEFVEWRPVLWQSGPQQKGQFSVQTRLLGAEDGGHRRRWMERLLFSPELFHAQWAVGSDEGDSPPTDGLAGVPEPAPGRGKPAGGAGSVALDAAAVA